MGFWTILLIILAVIAVIFIVLYILGNKLQKKQIAQKQQMQAGAQPVTMLIIDKKIMPMKDANLPKVVMDQTPKKYMKAKVPVVKAKIGAQIMTLICDDAIYDEVPIKGEVKAMVSGIYLVSVKNVRGKRVELSKKEAKRSKSRKQQAEYQRQLQLDMANKEKNSADKKKAKKDREREKKIKE